ncbi:MAG: cupin domain-containing protein [Nannocystaceae bacterium]|nr:cupin domain-containing protein [Nannocystaceae bacterium]
MIDGVDLDDELDPLVLDALASSLAPTPAPASSLRARLLQRMSGRDRFLPFLDRLIALFDLSEDETRRHVDTMVDGGASVDDGEGGWEELVPGCTFLDFDGGPALGDAHAGLIRLQPGAVFPAHRHVGEERVLMLQGRVRDEHGNEYRAGDLIVMADGTEHEITVVGDQEAIYAAVVVAMEFTGGDDGAEAL